MVAVALSRIFSYLAAFSGLWTLVKSPPGLLGGAVWIPKLWAGAWAPLWTLLGAFGALLGLLVGDFDAVLAGLLGAILTARHTLLVTRQHDAFAAAFGPGWQQSIPPSVKPRLAHTRYQLVQPAARGIPGQRNVILGFSDRTGTPLLCDIWYPPDGIPRTGLSVVYLHGGLWQAFDKDFLTQPLFRRLVNQGHVIMDVAYSLAPEAALDRMLTDVKQAIVWLKEHARTYQVRPDRIVLMGVSGGAHLALLAAYAPGHPAFRQDSPQADMSVRGVVSMFGITDLCAFCEEYGRSTRKQPVYSSQITDDLRPRIHDRTWLDRSMTQMRAFPAYRYGNMPGGALLLVNLLGGTLKEIPDAYRLASPIAHVGPHCPPTLQVFAEDDFVVPCSHGRRLHRALREADVPSVYIEFPETVHGFDQYFGVSRRISPAAQAATYDLERFLALMV